MFEDFAFIFVILGIVGSLLQAVKKGKRAGTGFPPPIKTEIREINIDEDKSLSKSPMLIRKGTYKPVPKKMEEAALTWTEVNPVVIPTPAQAKNDTEIKHHELSLDRKSVLNGVIFSVILSPPKCKRMDSIL